MRLVIIRHGASEHAARGLIAGPRGCPGLTLQGIDQVQALAARLRASREFAECTTILVSPVKRAVQTAEALFPVFPHAQILEEHRLIEVDPGEADGFTHDEYGERFGAFDLLAEPERVFAPGGESWSQFVQRVRALQQAVAINHAEETVIAVAHAGTIVATLLNTFDIPRPGTSARFDPRHTSLTEWGYDGSWILERYNDALHLQATWP